MSFEYLPHTADKKIKAKGKDKAEAFGEGALAMYNTIIEIKEIKLLKELKIKVEAESITGLLYDFIEELLFYIDTEKFIGAKVEEITIQEGEIFKLNATFKGDTYTGYEHHGDVKAMTYYDMEIKENEITFVVDV